MKKKKKSAFVIAVLFCMTCLCGCTKQEHSQITSIEQLNDSRYTIGVPEGAAGMFTAEEYLPNAQKKYIDSVTAYMAVSQGKLDAFVYDRVMMEFAIGNGLSDVKLLEENIGESMDVAVGISPKTEIENLTEKINQFLLEMKEDGTLDDMYYRWVTIADGTMPQIPQAKSPDCKLKIGTTGLVQPFSYYEGTTLTGYDIEMIYRFAQWMNAEVEIKVYDYGGVVAAAEAGEIDCIMANLNATEERREHILFSDCIYPSVTAVMVRDENVTGNVEGEREEKYQTLSDFSGARFGAISGGIADQLVQGVIDNAENFSYYNSVPDAIAALKANRIDAAALDDPIARLAAAKNEELEVFGEPVLLDQYGYAFPKGSRLRDQFNTIIARYKEDGTLDRLKEKWLGADDSVKVLPQQTQKGANGTIRYFHEATMEPLAYLGSNGEPLGLEIELMLLIAQELDMKVEMTSCQFASLIAALESGKADVASGSISITKERMERIDFADTYYESALVLLMCSQKDVDKEEGFFTGLKDSFHSTFVVEGRWRLIVQGLGVTVLISVLSGIFGLLLGFVICMLRRINHKPVKWICAAFVRLIQGTPIIVFLMILYYVIFGSVDVSGIFVAVVGFTINFGAYTSEMMRSGIDTVDKGQSEAALAMGYTKPQTFFKIVFPQAAGNFLPVLKGEFISMVKMTSVVGYIAVQDLTKVSDIIRSRTMEAFFPLIATAVIYFAVANGMTAVLSLVEKRLEPKRKKRTVKGVKMS